jgi:N-acetylmuramoyl-L-alanine amidase
MKYKLYRIYPIWLCMVILALLNAEAVSAREMLGMLDNQPIPLKTELLQKGEYVRAAQLVLFFPNRWQFDGLSGTLIFVRRDGIKVGLKVGEQRVLVGKKVIHTGKKSIRYQSRIYIPFINVKQFLLPSAQWKEGQADPGLVNNDPIVQPSATPTPFRVSQATPVVFPQTTPTPDIVFPSFDDLIATPTATYEPEATPDIYTAPRAVIVIDPGASKNIAQNAVQNVLSTSIRESDITQKISQNLAELILESPNYEVLFTDAMNDGAPLTPEQRAGFANQSNADMFISIQCGALYTDTISKAAIFFMNPQLDSIDPVVREASGSDGSSNRWDAAYQDHVLESLRLARVIHFQLNDYYSYAKIITMDSSPRPGRLQVLRGLTMPGVMIELGNLAHHDTAQHLSRKRVQEEIAYKIYLAINDFLYERTGYPPSQSSQSQ